MKLRNWWKMFVIGKVMDDLKFLNELGVSFGNHWLWDRMHVAFLEVFRGLWM